MHSSAQPFAARTICLGEELRLLADSLLRYLDDDLMHGGLDSVAELVPFFRHDRERRRELSESRRELVDLGGRRVPPGEDAEVDANLDARLVVLAHQPRDGGLVEEEIPCRTPIRLAELLTRLRFPAELEDREDEACERPRRARMASASGCVQTPCPWR